MLFTTAGTRLFIADPRVQAAGEWVEIAETEAFGLLGSEWQMDEVDLAHMGDGDKGGEIFQAKRSIRRLPMQVVLGNDPADPGVLLLWKAHHSVSDFRFRLLFPDGVTARYWLGVVTAMREVFDTANSVMRLQADILPTTQITDSEA